MISNDGIFVIDLEAGGATELIADYDPDLWLSPDGRRIAYTGDDGLYLADSDGSNQIQLAGTRAGRVYWYPDSSGLAYTSEAGAFVVDAAGQDQVKIIEPADAEHVRVPIVLSSDTSDIAYSTPEGLFIVDADGTNRRHAIDLTGSRYGYVFANRRVDATHVFFFTEDGFQIADIDGRNQRILAGWEILQSEWSPDGTRIAFCDHVGQYVADIYGNAPVRVEGSSDVPCTHLGPIWSEDSSHIAFGVSEALLIARSDGTRPQLPILRDSDNKHPVWSPDGTKVAYWIRDRHANDAEGLYVADLRSGDTYQIESLWLRTLSWSPDSTRIVSQGREGWLIADSHGGNRKQISSHHRGQPVWSPDGRFIAYNDRDGFYVTDSSANESKKLSRERYWALRWSDDGNLLAFQSESGIFVAQTGSDAQSLAEVKGHFEAALEWLPGGDHLIFHRWAIHGDP